MAEEPEQVLPQQRIAAPCRVEDRPVEGALQLQQGRAGVMPGARVMAMPTSSSTAPAIAEISMKPMPSSHQSAFAPGE